MASKKVILSLSLIFSTISFLELFRITTNTTAISSLLSSSSTATPIQITTCSCPPPAVPPAYHSVSQQAATESLTPKEQRLLSNLIALRAPCNLLFFGLKPQLLSVATLNVGGATIFLEDNWEKLQTLRPRSESIRVYQVWYHEAAGDAYNLLRQARAHPACMFHESVSLKDSSCLLALKHLPEEVYERKWDVIMVDGPAGDKPEAPGRMAVIYSASLMARRSSSVSDIFVHDVDRTIEKWYSWEFLCHQNLISSKGRLWHFRIQRNLNSSGFFDALPLLTIISSNTAFQLQQKSLHP